MTKDLTSELITQSELDHNILNDKESAHLFIHHNTVTASQTLPGLIINTTELKEGIKVEMTLKEGTKITKPVHLCFGMIPKEGVQRILISVTIEKEASIAIWAHCTFPNAVNVKHIMDAQITVGENSSYSYFERHVHGQQGGVEVTPRAVIELKEGGRFSTEFELLKGRVGLIDIDYETTCHKGASLEMDARINGIKEDIIRINETCYLKGENSRGVLKSRVALRDEARAEITSKIVASAAFARGHVDCKEIVQDAGVASAVPIVEVRHPKAHVTHEAAIGSVDSKELNTLMARGLTEDEAVELIIQGLLKHS